MFTHISGRDEVLVIDKLKVRLVIQGQHMRLKDDTGKGDYTDAFSPVPHASGLRILLAIATENDMFTDHVDISQAFTQGDLQPGDGYMGTLYISAPPGYPEDSAYCYRLLTEPLYGKPSAARAWFQTMSTFLKQEGCSKVGYEESTRDMCLPTETHKQDCRSRCARSRMIHFLLLAATARREQYHSSVPAPESSASIILAFTTRWSRTIIQEFEILGFGDSKISTFHC